MIQYLFGEPEFIPVIRMVRLPEDVIRSRCEHVAGEVRHRDLALAVIAVKSVIGGGTAPGSTLPSHALALRHARLSASVLLAVLRGLKPPIIGRIDEDRVLLDLRTVEPEFDEWLIQVLNQPLESVPDVAKETS